MTRARPGRMYSSRHLAGIASYITSSDTRDCRRPSGLKGEKKRTDGKGSRRVDEVPTGFVDSPGS